MSTGNRGRAVEGGVLFTNRSANAWWKEGGRTLGQTRFGRTGGTRANTAELATSRGAKLNTKHPQAATNPHQSKKIRRKARAVVARRIRSLRAIPPRFSSPRLENRRARVSVTPMNQPGLLGQTDYHEYQPFLKTCGEVGPTQWNRKPIDAILRTIDAACAGRGEPSPSSTIARDLDSVATGKDLQRAWASYTNLARTQSTHPVVQVYFPSSHIPSKLLSRLCRFIIQSHPVTASHFFSLLTVMQHIWDNGSPLPRYWWNALIRFAAEGQRRGGRHGVRRSLAVLNDFTKGLRPGSSLKGRRASLQTILDSNSLNKPNISTFNIVINIAADSLDGHLLREALEILGRSGLAPTRITHLAQLKYYAEKRQLDCVRDVVQRLDEDGMDLGTDGINACIWAYSLSNEHGIALNIYRVLRDNRTHDSQPKDITRLRDELETREHISIPLGARPDKRTYVMLIQTMAYSGKFADAVSIFADFLECTPRGRLHASTAPAFRAMFCGFSKYAVGRLEELTDLANPRNKWNLANLQSMYRLFLKLPPHVVPSRATIYWIIVAFDKASDHDVNLLRERWLELENRFTPESPWLFMQPRLQRIKAILFPTRDNIG